MESAGGSISLTAQQDFLDRKRHQYRFINARRRTSPASTFTLPRPGVSEQLLDLAHSAGIIFDNKNLVASMNSSRNRHDHLMRPGNQRVDGDALHSKSQYQHLELAPSIIMSRSGEHAYVVIDQGERNR